MSCDVVVRTSIGWCSSQKRALYAKRSQAVSATKAGNQGPKTEIRSRTHGCLSVPSLVFMSRLLGLAHEGARLHFRLSPRTRRENQKLLFATTAICSPSLRRPGGGNHNGERRLLSLSLALPTCTTKLDALWRGETRAQEH